MHPALRKPFEVGVAVVAEVEDQRRPFQSREFLSAQGIGVVGGEELQPHLGREAIEGSSMVCSLTPQLPRLFHTPRGSAWRKGKEGGVQKPHPLQGSSGRRRPRHCPPLFSRARAQHRQSNPSKRSAGREVEERASWE